MAFITLTSSAGGAAVAPLVRSAGMYLESLPSQMAQLSTSTAEASSMLDHLLSSQVTPDLLTFASTILAVTASDMVPFVPCQPLAIALGSTMGLWAFPICVAGQSLAGVLAFQSARFAADKNVESVNKVLASLTPQASQKFEEFRQLGSYSDKTNSGNGGDDDEDGAKNERTVMLALIGLRLAPFFPFSAGNYLLGGATGVGLRPFIIVTVLGCLLSNFVSISVGMGGAAVLLQSANELTVNAI